MSESAALLCGLLLGVVGAPILEFFQGHLDVVLVKWLWVSLLEQGLGPDGLQRCGKNSLLASLYFCRVHRTVI